MTDLMETKMLTAESVGIQTNEVPTPEAVPAARKKRDTTPTEENPSEEARSSDN